MLWSTLFGKLGKQPLKITQHQHVNAIIDGKRIELDLKFEANGTPYLVPRTAAPDKPRRPYKEIIGYTVSEEVSDVLGSGSDYRREIHVKTEAQAMAALRDRRNHMTRLVLGLDGVVVKQYWNNLHKCWEDHQGNPLPY